MEKILLIISIILGLTGTILGVLSFFIKRKKIENQIQSIEEKQKFVDKVLENYELKPKKK